MYSEETSHNTIRFVQEIIKQFPHPIQAIKTDNHSTFTNRYTGTRNRSDLTVKRLHALDQFCAQHNIVHYLIDPGKPAQNGTVERSHREDEEKFYQCNTFTSYVNLSYKLRDWNTYYNNLEHCGLDGKTPNEVVSEYLIQKPSKVLA